MGSPAHPSMLAARGALLVCLLAGTAWSAEWSADESAVALAELARTGDLICELRASGPLGRRPSAEMLLIIDGVSTKQAKARTFSSRRAGAHAVQIYAGETGVHLVEDVTGSVIVTTLLNCEARSKSGRCQRYAAVNAWHFDQSVHRDPDKAFRRLPGTSYSGYCDAWRMEEPVKAELDLPEDR